MQIGLPAGRPALSGLSGAFAAPARRRRHVSGQGAPPTSFAPAALKTHYTAARCSLLASLTVASMLCLPCESPPVGVYELRRQPQSPRRSVCTLFCGQINRMYCVMHSSLFSDHERQVIFMLEDCSMQLRHWPAAQLCVPLCQRTQYCLFRHGTGPTRYCVCAIDTPAVTGPGS